MTGVAFSIHCPSSAGQTIQTGRQNLRITGQTSAKPFYSGVRIPTS